MTASPPVPRRPLQVARSRSFLHSHRREDPTLYPNPPNRFSFPSRQQERLCRSSSGHLLQRGNWRKTRSSKAEEPRPSCTENIINKTLFITCSSYRPSPSALVAQGKKTMCRFFPLRRPRQGLSTWRRGRTISGSLPSLSAAEMQHKGMISTRSSDKQEHMTHLQFNDCCHVVHAHLRESPNPAIKVRKRYQNQIGGSSRSASWFTLNVHPRFV